MNERFIVRDEIPGDKADIQAVHAAAFPMDAEARLVDLLCERGKALVSLVAVTDEGVVGHILFSPVTIEAPHAFSGAGLAPLAVLPSCHRQGIGSALIRAGLDSCRARGIGYVVVLGDPAYYGRFGFTTASERGLANEYGAGAAFMVQELQAGALPTGGGLVRFALELAELGV
jgi:putative acetyltransferase